MELEVPAADMTAEEPVPPPPPLDMFILPPETLTKPPEDPDTNSEEEMDPYPEERSPPVAEKPPTVVMEVETLLEPLTAELELLTVELLMGPVTLISRDISSNPLITDPAPELLLPELPDEEAGEKREYLINFRKWSIHLSTMDIPVYMLHRLTTSFVN